MQKSKIFTLLIIVLIFVYALIANLILIPKVGSLYTFVINPIFYLAIALFLKFAIGKRYRNNKLDEKSRQYAVIACLSYIIINFLLGLITTFGNSAYSHALKRDCI